MVVGDGVAASNDRCPTLVVVLGVVVLGITVILGVVVGITSMICDEVLVVKVECE